MKMKTWHMFLVIIVLFCCSFYVVNLRFDKFYRVNGINNDNRVLIEQYLSVDEQTYLIDNQIPIDLFIHYIKEDDFHLKNYQYYSQLEKSTRYSKVKDILDVGNSLATRLTFLYNDRAFSQAKRLIDLQLETAFLNEENFTMDSIELYTYMKELYAVDDFSYVSDTERYIEKLNALGINKQADILHAFEMLTQAYSKESLAYLFDQELDDNVHLVLNPYELSTIVNKNNYIGEYEPKDLILIQDVPRVRYAMYLQTDAAQALTRMYQDFSKDHQGFLLREAYTSYETLEESQVGYCEEQLGLTIHVSQSDVSYDLFQKTKMSQWLEKHAHEYGFILRYPREKATFTNHKYDSHIYRYVGKSLAQSIYENQYSLEEFQAKNR